jgi:DNA replication protein DnaC
MNEKIVANAASKKFDYDEFYAEQKRKAKAEREELIKDKHDHPEKYLPYSIPKKFRQSSFESFTGGDAIKKICRDFINGYERAIRYVDGVPAFDDGLKSYPGSLLFSGQTGSGKTHIAVAVVRELVKEDRLYRATFTTAPEILLSIRNTFNKHDNDDDHYKTEDEVISDYADVELLIIDDLGSEKTTDFTIQSLYLIIDRRNRELMPTIITTNLSLKEIEEKLDARIASRLADMKIIKINMPDYRKKR